MFPDAGDADDEGDVDDLNWRKPILLIVLPSLKVEIALSSDGCVEVKLVDVGVVVVVVTSVVVGLLLQQSMTCTPVKLNAIGFCSGLQVKTTYLLPVHVIIILIVQESRGQFNGRNCLQDISSSPA